MFNMIRMDLYRLFKGKSLYVVLGVGIIVAVLTQCIFYVLSNADLRNMIMAATAESISDEDVLSVTGMTMLEYIDTSMFRGGFYPVMLCILAVLFTGSDYKNGYVKNIFAYRSRRFAYLISKLFTMIIAGFFLSFLLFTVLIAMSAILPLGYAPSSFADIAWYFITIQFLDAGFIGMMLFVMMLTRSESAGIGAAIVVVGGLVTMLLEQFAHLFGRSLSSFSLVLKHMNVPMGFEQTITVNYWMTGIIWCVIYILLAAVFLYKKDIA